MFEFVQTLATARGLKPKQTVPGLPASILSQPGWLPGLFVSPTGQGSPAVLSDLTGAALTAFSVSGFFQSAAQLSISSMGTSVFPMQQRALEHSCKAPSWSDMHWQSPQPCQQQQQQMPSSFNSMNI